MDTVTGFLLEDGQVVSELPEGRDAAKHVKIRVDSHDDGITVEIFVPCGSGIYRSTDINQVAQDASSEAGCIRRWSSRQRVACPGVGERWTYTFPDPVPPPIGPRGAEALEFIRLHPGVSMVEVYQNCAGHPKPFGGRPNYLHRLIKRGFVDDRGRSNRAALYAFDASDDEYRPYASQESEDNDRRDKFWVPAGHP